MSVILGFFFLGIGIGIGMLRKRKAIEFSEAL